MNPFFNPMTKTCVKTCPNELKLDGEKTDGVCKTCVAATSVATPAWDAKNNKCVSCFDADSTKPQWDSANSVCKACDQISGNDAYWNPMTSACVETCPIALGTVDASTKVCKTCVEATSEATPAWKADSSNCVSCFTKSEDAPYWDATE